MSSTSTLPALLIAAHSTLTIVWPLVSFSAGLASLATGRVTSWLTCSTSVELIDMKKTSSTSKMSIIGAI
ncbi:MAG: hypothetical protein WDN28_05620 [Chthoniobacter sp.]